MRYFLPAVLVFFMLSVCAHAEDAICGDYIGDWSGVSGAGGSFKLSIAAENGMPTCTVTFSYIEAQYDFDLGGNRLQSTIHGQRKENALAGKYETKALADGSAVDQGDWKATSAK